MQLTNQVIAGVLAGAGGLIAFLLLWVVRARRLVKAAAVAAQGCCGDAAVAEVVPKPPRWNLAALRGAWSYLRTPREWRYRTPWIMLLGETDGGKTSIAASIPLAHRAPADWRAVALAVPGTTGAMLDQGLLIDPQGWLPSAAPGTTQTLAWDIALTHLASLRPERPLDGLMLVVSARSLLAESPLKRQALADNAFRQIDDIAGRFEFLLPVYVVVTETDAVPGFTAFWQAQEERRLSEMFGWSSPAGAGDGTPQEWGDCAFDMLGERLRALQVRAAADRDEIADADHFFLFPRHFQMLRAPLKDWLGTVFKSSAWRSGFLCRGIYFTGSLAAQGMESGQPRQDVAFVKDLIVRKVFDEPLLARPARQGLWSRNRLLRRLQMAGVAVFVGLLLCLAYAAQQLRGQIDALQDAVQIVRKVDSAHESDDPCIGRQRVHDLLVQVARIDADLRFAAIPASWVDVRAARKSAMLVSDNALLRVVFPGLDCMLDARANELSAQMPSAVSLAQGDPYPQARKALADYLNDVRALELNLARMHALSGHGAKPARKDLLPTLIAVTEYAYGAPLPAQAKQDRGALTDALADVRFANGPHLPAGMRTRIAARIAYLSAQLRAMFHVEVGIGAPLAAHLAEGREPVLENTRRFTRWLGWAGKSWLGSTAKRNPCAEIETELRGATGDLVSRYRYPAKLEKTADAFTELTCYQPAMRTLAAMQLPPYGPLFVELGGALQLSAELTRELDGLTALAALNYMQVQPTRRFACDAQAAGWRAADIGQAAGYAKEYRKFAALRGLDKPDLAPSARPLYDRLARRQLESAMDTSMHAAQISAAEGARTGGIDPTSTADQLLSRRADAFGAAQPTLLEVLHVYDQYDFGDAATLTGCVRHYAMRTLADISALEHASRLYDPEPGPKGGKYVDLGPTAAVKDYLARQTARAQVLAGYATPFVQVLQRTEAVDDAHADNEQTAPYWSGTITELNRYVQAKEPNGQVAQLDALFLQQLPGMDDASCAKTLAAQPAEQGNDLFSTRRARLEDRLRARCDKGRAAQADQAFHTLAQRFNAQLAGRYPFADAGLPDANPDTVRTFFLDYAGQRATLRQALDGMAGPRWAEARRFLDQLDAVAAFFSGTLVAGDDSSAPVRLNVTFRARPELSPGSEQVVGMLLTSGARTAGYPNRATALDWPYGQAIALDLTWANRSLSHPVASPPQAQPRVEGQTATFTASGDWALLRLLEARRPRQGPAFDPLDPNRVLLEFVVPVTRAEAASSKPVLESTTFYLGLNLSAKDPKTQAPVALKPPAFPRFAPQ